jgi:hypothetical protein
VLWTLATFEAETSRRRAAAFMPDSAIVEMLLIKGSSDRWSGQHLMHALVSKLQRQRPNSSSGDNGSFTIRQGLLCSYGLCAGDQAARRPDRGSPRKQFGMTARTVMPLEAYDSRISSSRRPSLFSNFFTALEAITSPWLA